MLSTTLDKGFQTNTNCDVIFVHEYYSSSRQHHCLRFTLRFTYSYISVNHHNNYAKPVEVSKRFISKLEMRGKA